MVVEDILAEGTGRNGLLPLRLHTGMECSGGLLNGNPF